MKKNELIGWTAVFFAALSAAAMAEENLLPETFVNDLCQRQKTGVTYLKTEGEMPEGVLVTTDRAHDPIYRNETSAAIPCAVKKGDLLMEFDIDVIKEAGYSLETPVLITNPDDVGGVEPLVSDGEVKHGDPVVKVL